MIDRIEELLSRMAAEEDDGQEDAPVLEAGGRPPAVLRRRDGDETAEDGREEDGPGAPDGAPEGLDAPAAEGPEEEPVLSWDRPAPLPPPESARNGEEDGPAPHAAAQAEAGDGWALPAAGPDGLEELYRQTARETLPPAALPAPQAGMTGLGPRAAEPGTAASLAVGELDRAVRRDSRRYDGGMTIY